MLRSLLLRLRGIGFVVALLLSSRHDAFAQLAFPSTPVLGPCPAGNVLGKPGVTARGLTHRQLTTLVDGSVAPEGSVWPAEGVLVGLHGGVAFDLGRPLLLGLIRLQADADQAIAIDASADGTTWGRLTLQASPSASGMLTRTLGLRPSPVRYLRIAAAAPARDLALTELLASCNEGPEPAWHVVGGRSDLPPAESVTLTPSLVNLIKLAVALLALLTLLAARFLPARRMQTNVALGALALLSAGAYFDFGAYHHPEFVHAHDVFHYFVGARYFPELGYDSLYECAAVAEADAGYTQRVELRAQRDLRTNQLVSGHDVLAHHADCMTRFTKDRWHAFTDDVRYFASRSTVEAWHVVLRDHGFNASPTWIAVGRAIVRRLPATDGTIGHGSSVFSSGLGLFDPALLVVAVGLIVWAFGFRAAAFAVIAFGCNPLAEFSWVGGGFLRQLWFTALVSGLCFMKRGHHAKSALAFVFASALQLFPAISLVVFGASAAVEAVRSRRLTASHRRFALAASLALAFVIPASALATGRGDAWSAFARDMAKHAATPSVNLVGLPSALSFRPSTRAILLFDDTAVDPFARIRHARSQNLQRVSLLRWLGVAVGAFLLFRLVRRRLPDADVTALALAFVPFAVETSSYYTAWIAVLVLSATTDGPRAVVMALVAAELCVSRLVTDPDTQYAVASWVLVAAMLGILASASAFLRPASAASAGER